MNITGFSPNIVFSQKERSTSHEDRYRIINS